MRTTVRIGLLVLAAALLAAVLWWTASPEPEAVGTPAPPTHGADADGKTFALEDFRGKVVLLDFWGNW